MKINNEKAFVIPADPTEVDVANSSSSGVYSVLDCDVDNIGGSVTKSIQDAMEAAANYFYSIVFVPPGLYAIGNLLICDSTSLYLAGGSMLRLHW